MGITTRLLPLALLFFSFPSFGQGRADCPLKPIQVVVLLSDPLARIYFNGAATQQTGTRRRYYSAPVDSCLRYHYEITLVGRPHSRVVRVEVFPGREKVIDFRR